MNQIAGIHRILNAFRRHLSALGAKPSNRDLENLARLIDESMSSDGRHFHRTHHVFDLLNDRDAIQSLAALFHDIVYFQVDHGLPAMAAKLLKPYVQVANGEITLLSDAHEDQPGIGMICEIFRVKSGQTLTVMGGMNEFLSAIVCYEALRAHLSDPTLLQIAVCIEATIPFRLPTADVVGPMQALENRLRECNQKHGLKIDEKTIVETVQRAVLLSNEDVKNFSSDDTGWFLANTWRLISETNTRLRHEFYTVKDYRHGMQKMESFFGMLHIESVFRSHKGVPDQATHAKLEKAALRNVELSRAYMKAKVAAAALLEALAETTGGDLPISMLVGDIRRRDEKKQRMEDFLPPVEVAGTVDPTVLHLLRHGRAIESCFDMKNSPLAAFIYQHVGDDGIEALAAKYRDYFEGRLDANGFLAAFPKKVVVSVADACAKVCETRKPQLESFSKAA